MKRARLIRINMLVIIIAIVFFIIGRLTAKYKLVLRAEVIGDVSAASTAVAPDTAASATPVEATAPAQAAPTPAETPLDPATMTDRQIYFELLKVYLECRHTGGWRNNVPNNIRNEYVSRGLTGRGHGISCDFGTGLQYPNLSL